MFDAKQIILLLSSLAICAPGQVQVDNIHNLALPLDRDQVGRQDLRVETSLGPVVGEERWGWDSRFNQQISYTAFTVGRRNKFFTKTLHRVFLMLSPQSDPSGSCLLSHTNLGPTRPMWRCLSSGAVFRLPTNQMRMRFLIFDSRSQGHSIWQRMQDCLLLNLYVPTGIEVAKSGLPVMVWLHGGAFLFGQGWDC